MVKRKRRDSKDPALQPSKRANTQQHNPKAKHHQSISTPGQQPPQPTTPLRTNDSRSSVVIIPTQAAHRKAKPMGKKSKKMSKTKMGNLSDESDTAIKEEKVGKSWSTQETDQLLNAILGVDSKYWDNFQKNPTRVFKHVSVFISMMQQRLTLYQVSRKVFNLTRMPDAVKGCYNRLLKTYKAILRLENWTGNGSQDPDVDQRIVNARNAAIDLPKELTAKAIDVFQNKERWYSLFESR
jgi:hypothetical protein